MSKVMTSIVVLVSLIFCVNFVASSLTIKADNGQIFKCVDFHKQPAFRKSKVDLQVLSNLAKLQNQESVSGLGFGSHRKCPIGTVPILYRSKLNSPYQQLDNVPAKQHCTAEARTILKDNNKFLGASGSITIYKPKVLAKQWSSNQIRLSNGPESVQAGWMIHPSEFNNSDAHLYAGFITLGKSCLNLDCSGFVQVSTDVPLGLRLSNYSNATMQVSLDINIAKHSDGNWWLAIADGTHKIGYWPKTLFSLLTVDSANQVAFGGEIANLLFGVGPPTPMGNGAKAVADTSISSYIFHARVTDQKSSTIDLQDTEIYADCSDLYTVLDVGTADDLGRTIFYGGPGPSS